MDGGGASRTAVARTSVPGGYVYAPGVPVRRACPDAGEPEDPLLPRSVSSPTTYQRPA